MVPIFINVHKRPSKPSIPVKQTKKPIVQKLLNRSVSPCTVLFLDWISRYQRQSGKCFANRVSMVPLACFTPKYSFSSNVMIGRILWLRRELFIDIHIKCNCPYTTNTTRNSLCRTRTMSVRIVTVFALLPLIDLVTCDCSLECNGQTRPEWKQMHVYPIVGGNAQTLRNTSLDDCKETAQNRNANILLFDTVSQSN